MQNDEYTPDLEQDEKNNQEGQDSNESENQDQNQNVESNEDKTDWKAEALKQKAINDRLNKRLNSPQAKEQSQKPEGLDFGAKAYLKASGINATEFDFFSDELKNSGMKDFDSLLNNEYFKAKLENRRNLEKTQNATIKGKSPNGIATDSIEYWMSKPIEEVPAHIRIKVVNARMSKENQSGVFYNS